MSRHARTSASCTASSAAYPSRRIRRAIAYRRWYAAPARASKASWSPCCARSTSSDVTPILSMRCGHLPHSQGMSFATHRIPSWTRTCPATWRGAEPRSAPWAAGARPRYGARRCQVATGVWISVCAGRDVDGPHLPLRFSRGLVIRELGDQQRLAIGRPRVAEDVRCGRLRPTSRKPVPSALKIPTWRLKSFSMRNATWLLSGDQAGVPLFRRVRVELEAMQLGQVAVGVDVGDVDLPAGHTAELRRS